MASRGERIAQAALSHAGSSSRLHPDVYQDIVRRPADASSMFDQFYLRNRDMSSCGLLAVGALRLADCTAPECVAPYFPQGGPERDAVGDIQTMARRAGAWCTSSPPVPLFLVGDIWVVANAAGMDAHVGVCVADAVAQGDGTRVVNTVEGGQFSGSDSSAIEAFTRTWHLVGGRWALGDRFLVGFAVADKMPVPDGFAPDPGAGAASGADTKNAA